MSEKLISLMNDARLIAAADNVIFPMLEKMIAMRLEQASGKFRSGEKDFASDMAYIVALQDILQKLGAVQSKGMAAIEKLHKEVE